MGLFLLENGTDHLLLEDGSRLLLEDGSVSASTTIFMGVLNVSSFIPVQSLLGTADLQPGLISKSGLISAITLSATGNIVPNLISNTSMVGISAETSSGITSPNPISKTSTIGIPTEISSGIISPNLISKALTINQIIATGSSNNTTTVFDGTGLVNPSNLNLTGAANPGVISKSVSFDIITGSSSGNVVTAFVNATANINNSLVLVQMNGLVLPAIISKSGIVFVVDPTAGANAIPFTIDDILNIGVPQNHVSSILSASQQDYLIIVEDPQLGAAQFTLTMPPVISGFAFVDDVELIILIDSIPEKISLGSLIRSDSKIKMFGSNVRI